MEKAETEPFPFYKINIPPKADLMGEMEEEEARFFSLRKPFCYFTLLYYVTCFFDFLQVTEVS